MADEVDNAQDKAEIGLADAIRHARDAGFPKDKYRLLCHNCNQSMGWYGYCPHQKEKACG